MNQEFHDISFTNNVVFSDALHHTIFSLRRPFSPVTEIREEAKRLSNQNKHFRDILLKIKAIVYIHNGTYA